MLIDLGSIHVYMIAALQDNYIYLVHDLEQNMTIAVDPGDFEALDSFLQQKKWFLNYVWNTHHHWDHTDANLALKSKYNCKIIGSQSDVNRIPGIDIAVSEKETLVLGDLHVDILETPGHTLGAICFWIKKAKALFTGDTLFSMGCGRLFEGSPKQMFQSLSKIQNLPNETLIFCGHEYSYNNGLFCQSVDKNNAFLAQRMSELKELQAKSLPTVPTSLETEKKINVFLRAAHKQLKMDLQLHQAQDWQVFKQLRLLKDQF